MDDVFGQVMLTGADENLGAGNTVGAVIPWCRLGADQAEIGTAMGFGQTHGTGPDAINQLGQIEVFQLIRAVQMNGVIGPL